MSGDRDDLSIVLEQLAEHEPAVANALSLLAWRALELVDDGSDPAPLVRAFRDRWAPGLNEATAIDAGEWVREWAP